LDGVQVAGPSPNEVVLIMDEDRFQSGFVEHAIWTYGKGPFASLAYCGEGLTIQRYEKLEDAVRAKQAIDGGSCGGGCCKVNILVRADAGNPRAAKEQSNIREYVSKASAR
jgi:hypothetical protein